MATTERTLCSVAVEEIISRAGWGQTRLNGVDRDDSFNQQVGPDLLIGGIRPAERGVLQRSAEQPDFQLPPASQSSSENSDVIDEAFADVLLPELLEL